MATDQHAQDEAEDLSDEHEHSHSHGLVHDSIKRSREGVRAVLTSLAVLGIAIVQTIVFVFSGSVALLADPIHNFRDTLTAVLLGIAFVMRSERAERIAGLFVVAAIFISALRSRRRGGVATHPPQPADASVGARAVGSLGNFIAARVRRRAEHRLDSPALIADGDHAAADAYVSLAVIASAIVVAVGLLFADPLIGLAITAVILRITCSPGAPCASTTITARPAGNGRPWPLDTIDFPSGE